MFKKNGSILDGLSAHIGNQIIEEVTKMTTERFVHKSDFDPLFEKITEL